MEHQRWGDAAVIVVVKEVLIEHHHVEVVELLLGGNYRQMCSELGVNGEGLTMFRSGGSLPFFY
jgi:hypothetical protein